MNRPTRIPTGPRPPTKDAGWHVYRFGSREGAFLGTVDALNRDTALALAEEQWPEHLDHLHVGSGAFGRKKLAKLNTRLERNPEGYAFHEAGHAAVARRFGWPVRSVSILPELYSHGGDFHPQLDSSGRVAVDCEFPDLESPDHREDAEQYMLFGLAGPTAEYRFRGRSQWNRQGDVAAISRYLWAHAPEGRDDEYLQELKLKAAALVDEVWPDIEAVAAELVKRRELSGDEVERIVRTKSNVLLSKRRRCGRARDRTAAKF